MTDINNSNLSKIIENFSKYILIEKQLSKHTNYNYLIDIKLFLNWCEKYMNLTLSKSNVNKISIEHLRLWLSSRIDKGISNRSNARSISGIKTFFQYMQDNRIDINKNIFNIKKPRLPKLLPKAISFEEFEKLMLTIEENLIKDWKSYRNIALITTLFATGMRISEAVLIKKCDIATDRDFFYITGKGNKTRIIPIIPIVKERINKYLEICEIATDKNDLVFLSDTGKAYSPRMAQKMMQEISNLFGLSIKITPHTLRHSCATALIENSDELQKIQRLLGHKNLSTTQIYTKITKNKLIESIKEAID